jgi:hypothetical protein
LEQNLTLKDLRWLCDLNLPRNHTYTSLQNSVRDIDLLQRTYVLEIVW